MRDCVTMWCVRMEVLAMPKQLTPPSVFALLDSMAAFVKKVLKFVLQRD